MFFGWCTPVLNVLCFSLFSFNSFKKGVFFAVAFVRRGRPISHVLQKAPEQREIKLLEGYTLGPLGCTSSIPELCQSNQVWRLGSDTPAYAWVLHDMYRDAGSYQP